MHKTTVAVSKKHILILFLLNPTKVDSLEMGSFKVALLTLLNMLKHQLTKPKMKIIHI